MAAQVEGTFSGTGASDGVHGRKIQVMMDFTGQASVDIEVFGPNNSWIKYGQPITADHYSVIEDTAGVSVRLNCTAHTDDVVYSLKAMLGSGDGA